MIKLWRSWPKDVFGRRRKDITLYELFRLGTPGWLKSIIVLLSPAVICLLTGPFVPLHVPMIRFVFGLMVIGIPLWILLSLMFFPGLLPERLLKEKQPPSLH